MKQFLTLSFLIISLYGTSQNQKIDAGLYKSRSEGTEILLKLNEDKTFEMTFFHGTYTFENDSLRFNTKNKSLSKFTVNPIKDAEYSSNLNLLFEGSLYSYYTSGIFIGTQKNANTQTEYRRLSDYLDTENSDDMLENVSIEIPKSQYLYLVQQNYEGETEISKFEIGENTNKAVIDFNPYSLNDIKLVGYIDPETQKLAITDSKKAVYFTYEKAEDFDKQLELQPISVETSEDWAKINGFEEDVSEYAYEDYGESNFDFQHVTDKTFKDALQTAKKTPSKFLVVAFDLQNSKRENEFTAFIKASESIISSYMYSGYNAEYDSYNFYLATDKDKKLLSSKFDNGSKQILVYNNNGELLYHTTGTLSENSELFAPYGELNSALIKANTYVLLDALITNNKTKSSEFIKVLSNALSISPSHDYSEYAVTDVVTPAMDVEETSAEIAVVDDTMETTDDYNSIKDAKNLYTLKSSREVVEKNWNSSIDAYSKSKVYDSNFVKLIKRELSDDGFMKRLFETKNEKGLSNTDFKLLDYVFDNYSTIASEERNITASEYDTVASYDSYYDDTKDIATVLENNVFSYENVTMEYVKDAKKLQKTLAYDKKYLDLVNPSFNAYYNYLNALSNMSVPNELNKDYLDAYASVFKDILKKDANVIESLDASFTKKTVDDYNTWSDFKYLFATTANSAAWYVVENESSEDYLKQAIHWSETSLIIDKTSHYYLDTLAQLYYKNGDKEKAIITEQKAIDLVEDSENKAEYQTVLTKMKNGSY